MCRVNYILAICVMLWVPIASGQQTSAAVPQPVAPAVAVQMIDLVDSSRDPTGKQYRAGLIRPVNISNGVIIAQGSAATVVLVKNGPGWNVQLSSLVMKGQVTTVTSNPGTVIGAAAQSNVANAADAANAVLGSFGRKPNTYSPAAVVAMDERVILTPGISLSFVLNPVPVVPEASPAAAPAPANPAPVSAGQGAPAQAQKQKVGGGWWWYCWAGDYRYMTGVFFYPADVWTFADVDAAINTAWGNHVKREYPNGGAGCTVGGTDQASTQTIHDHMRAGQKVKVIDVDWKYVPGQDTPTVASGKGKPSYCYGYHADNKALYFSDTFEMPPDTPRYPVMTGFARFVIAKYGLDPGRDGMGSWYGGVMCSEGDKSKHNNEMGYKIIETGWKPKSLPPPQGH